MGNGEATGISGVEPAHAAVNAGGGGFQGCVHSVDGIPPAPVPWLLRAMQRVELIFGTCVIRQPEAGRSSRDQIFFSC